MDSTPLPVSPRLWQRTLKSNGTIVLTLSIRRPAFPESGKYKRMERYFSHLSQQWQSRWETILYSGACRALTEQTKEDSPFDPWQATLDYKITLWQPPLISLQLDIQETTSSPLPQLLRIGEVWNTETGYPCSMRQFLPPKPRRWKHGVVQTLCEQVQHRLNSGESLLRPDCSSDLEKTFDPDRFYLTEEGIVLYYPMYILGPFGEGIPTFTIPISEQVQSNKLRAPSITARR